MRKFYSILVIALLCVSAEMGFAQVSQTFHNSETYVESVLDAATLQALSQEFSIDRVQRNDDGTFNTRIWLSYLDYDNFLARGIPYTVAQPTRATVTMATNYAEMVNGWNRYPTYNTYLAMMDTFQTRYPSLCKIDTILAATPNSHKILCAHISNNLNDNMGKPSILYISTMHGDEVVGYYFMLRLIDMLLSNYNTNTKITNMVNNFDIWICPDMNPDGTYKTSDTQINESPTSTRANYNGVDMNRYFPQPGQSIGSSSSYEPEVWAMMQFMSAHNFTLAANFHGGAEVFNYPWDKWTTSQHAHADDAWWQYVGRKFADTCHIYSSSYFTEENNGITEGGDWYVITGSMQDYHNWFLGTRHVTIEVGDKVLNSSVLPNYWGYAYHSLLNFIEEAGYGIHGTVTDSLTGEPLQAMVYVNNHDADHSYVETTLPYGDYHRPIKAGQYSVTYSADGYFSKTITVNVSDGAKLIQNVQLVSTDTSSCRKPKNVTVNYISGNSAEVSWYSMAQSNNIMLNNTLITDVTSPYTLTDLAFSTQYDVQVQANCGENDLSEWSESVSFTTPVACPAPTNLSCPAVTATTATLNWTENGEATDWVIQYGTNSNFTSGTYSQVEVNGNATKILTGLSAETDYYARVKADCGDVFGQSDWSATCTFKPTSIQMVEIGSGTATNNYLPLNGSRKYSLSEQIYTTTELGEAGNIVSIDFYKNSTTSCNRSLDIYLVSTDKSYFSGNSDWITVTSADKVFTGTVNFANNDWTTITLTTPFAYDGTHNVAIIVDDNTGSSSVSGWSSSSIPFLTYTGSSNQSIYYYNGNSFGGSSTNPDPTGSLSSASGVTASKNQIRVLIDRPDPVVCLAPTALTASDIDHQSAMLGWSGEADSWTVAFKASDEEQFTEVAVNTNSYNLTELLPETAYMVKVAANCGEETVWCEEITFSTLPTPCYAPTDLAAVEFDHQSAMLGWSGEADSWTVAFKASDEEQFTEVAVNTNSYNLTELLPETAYMVKVAANCGEETVWCEEITFSTLPVPCPAPVNIMVTNVDRNSAVVSWTEAGNATSWVVAYRNDIDELFTEMEVSEPTYALSDLAEGTLYIVKVRPVCDGITDSWSYTEFNTESCYTIPLTADAPSWTENFDNYTQSTTAATDKEPDCWELVRTDVTSMPNDKRPQLYYRSDFAHSGSYSLLLNYRGVYAMPAMSEEVSLKDVKLEMYLRQPNAAYCLEVGVWDDATNTFDQVKVINNATTEVELVMCDFSDYPGNGRRVAFRNVLNNGKTWSYSYNYLDDITLTLKGTESCLLTLPSTETFEDYTSVTTTVTGVEPTCWELVEEEATMPDSKKPQLYYKSDFAHSGDYSLLLNYRGVYAMPVLDPDIEMNQVQLEMYVRQPNKAYQLEVGVWDEELGFEAVALVNNTTTNITRIVCNFAEYTGNGRRIAFRNVLGSGNYAYSYNYIDDITLTTSGLADNCDGYISTLPYEEDFEDFTGVEPDCWELVLEDVQMPDDKKPQLYYRSDFAHSGDHSLKMGYRCVYAMPSLDATDADISDLHLSMYLRQPNTAYTLEVGVWEPNNDPEQNETGVFVPVHVFNNKTSDVTFVECDFSNYTGDGGRIAFRNTLSNGKTWSYSYNYIDDINLGYAEVARGATTDESVIDVMGAGRDMVDVVVYPNPTRDFINVQCTTDNVQCSGIEVIDVYGKVVRTVVGANNDSPTQINVSDLAAGMYFVRVTTEEGAVTKPFVKR